MFVYFRFIGKISLITHDSPINNANRIGRDQGTRVDQQPCNAGRHEAHERARQESSECDLPQTKSIF